MGKFVIYSLEHCPFSSKAEELFKQSSTNYKIIKISRKNSEKYKNSVIKTFPQIYYFKKYGKDNRDKAVLGGYTDFSDMIETQSARFLVKPNCKDTEKEINEEIRNKF